MIIALKFLQVKNIINLEQSLRKELLKFAQLVVGEVTVCASLTFFQS